MTPRPLVAVALLAAACGGKKPADQAPAPAAPLPTAGIAGEEVTVYPITLLTADSRLGWDSLFAPRRAALDRADSIFGALLVERAPEVTWVLPPALRHAATRAPGMLTDPDRMGTALLRSTELKQLPDPLRSQMRNLSAVAGGRYALVPAAVVFRAADVPGKARAEITLVMADVRTGLIGWRTLAHAEGTDPWTALRDAIKTLTPGLP